MIISFDIDDVLAEFQLGWIEFNARKYDLHFTMEDITDYDYSKTGIMRKEDMFPRIFEFYETELFKQIQPTAGAIEVVQQLAKENTLYVLTSRPSEIRDTTKNWIDTYFGGYFVDILQTGQVSRAGHNPSITKVDICKSHGIQFHIDDAPMHATSLADAGVRVAVPEKPWNRNFLFESPNIVRFKEMVELLKILEK